MKREWLEAQSNLLKWIESFLTKAMFASIVFGVVISSVAVMLIMVLDFIREYYLAILGITLSFSIGAYCAFAYCSFLVKRYEDFLENGLRNLLSEKVS